MKCETKRELHRWTESRNIDKAAHNEHPKGLFGVNSIGGGNTSRLIIATAQSAVFLFVRRDCYNPKLSIWKCKRIVKYVFTLIFGVT